MDAAPRRLIRRPGFGAGKAGFWARSISSRNNHPRFRLTRCYDDLMTMLGKTEQLSDQGIAHTRGHLARELGETIRLAAPMALTQLGQIAMMTTDLVFIGRLGNEALAAAALGGTIFWVSFTFGMGLMAAVAPLAAQA